jgi:hypothetical protein
MLARLDAVEFDDEPVTAEDQAAIDSALEEPSIPWRVLFSFRPAERVIDVLAVRPRGPASSTR